MIYFKLSSIDIPLTQLDVLFSCLEAIKKTNPVRVNQ